MPHTASPLPAEVDQLLQRLGVTRAAYTSGTLAVRSPITGETIAQLPQTSPAEASAAIARAQ
ncbi:MAG: aldehyde dehydrogenase family protein, partial [Rhodoferax sp.]